MAIVAFNYYGLGKARPRTQMRASMRTSLSPFGVEITVKEVDWGRIGLKKKMFIAAVNTGKLLYVLFSKK